MFNTDIQDKLKHRAESRADVNANLIGIAK